MGPHPRGTDRCIRREDGNNTILPTFAKEELVNLSNSFYRLGESARITRGHAQEREVRDVYGWILWGISTTLLVVSFLVQKPRDTLSWSLWSAGAVVQLADLACKLNGLQ